MTKTDRDRSIEQLLRHAPANRMASDGPCPDAETLAATVDDGLTADERRGVEAHVIGCVACQTLMAAMAQADTAAATARSTEGASVVPWWKSRRFVAYFVPAAAAAVAIAIWVAIPGQQAPMTGAQPAVEPQMASAEPERRADVPAPDGAQTQPDDRVGSLTDNSRAVGAPRESAAQAAASPATTIEPAAPPLPPPTSMLSKNENDALRTETPAPAERQTFEERAAPAPPPSPPPPVAPTIAASSNARASTALDVVSSDAQIRWRIGPGSTVQHSTDGGTTWIGQRTGTSTELVAGASPVPAVCWLVGRTGTVLRTVDGGSQWQQLPFPETTDLVGVAASSSVAATVTTADGRRFSTSDAGLTWTR